MIEAQATARGVRTSAQKAGLVCELIRGKNVNQALATLQFTRKTIARELAKVLRSAVANLQQQDGFSGDIDRLYVAACYANQGDIELQVKLWKRMNGTYPAANLSDIGANTSYFPSPVPVCPVDGTSYTINTTTGLVIGHTH